MSRKLAAILAAAMTMTTAASFSASADTGFTASGGTTLTVDTAVTMETDTLFQAFEELVPGGKLLSPYVRLFANDLMGKGKNLSLDDINSRIEELFSKVEALNEDLRDSIVNITAIQNFDTFQFKTFNSQIKEIIGQIQIIRTLDISEENKFARIAALVNNSSTWAESNNVFVTFSDLTQTLNRASLIKSGDIFTIIYEHFAKSSMFSAEAVDKARAAVDLIMTDYAAGYIALLECLSAQAKVCNMTAEQKSAIDVKYLSRITDEQELINKKINDLSEDVMGRQIEKTVTEKYLAGYREVRTQWGGYDRRPYYKTREKKVTEFDNSGIRGRYNSFINTPRNILINGDTAEAAIDKTLSCADTYNLAESGVFIGADEVARRFNSRIAQNQAVTGDQIRALAKYSAGKGLTIREYLERNGFNTDRLPAHTIAAAGDAYDDTLTVRTFAAGLVGSMMTHTMIKGFDIDEKNPAEQEIIIWNTGIHVIAFEGWSFGEHHNIAIFNGTPEKTDIRKLAETIARNCVIC